MQINFESPFPLKCYDWDGLFRNFLDDHSKCKVSTFKNRLRSQSEENPNKWEPHKYVGDGFECFCEALIKIMGTHRQIAIYDYELVKDENDMGVDGVGKGWDGNPATVQAKFRSDVTEFLTANKDHLTNFSWQSTESYGVNTSGDYKNMLIITTAKDLHPESKEKMFYNNIRVLGYRELKKMLDGNMGFWTKFKQLGDEQIEAANN